MSELTPWFSRSFPFPVSVELLPHIASRLRGTPVRLEALLKDVDSERLKSKQHGQWSIQEHAGHLLDIEPLWLSRVEDFANGASELTPTDLRNSRTDEADHNAKSLAAILHAFSSARAALLRRIEDPTVIQISKSIQHPRLCVPMGIADHLYFVAEHDDHHLATIHSLLTL
ncbi:DinB family protein [Silvibacterium acidisoli]|uniref:DinB family protein n=1 Tax=Acidobacteriaceae bacterium ZG23-2 TaxID=2883246 RepID=UPI00406C4BA5